MLIFVQVFGGNVQLPKVLKTSLGYPQMDTWFGRVAEALLSINVSLYLDHPSHCTGP